MNQLKIAVVYEDDRIYCQIKPEDFRKLLQEKILATNSVDSAMDAIEQEIRFLAMRV